MDTSGHEVRSRMSEIRVSVRSSLRCLSARCQCRAQMPNFVFYIARIFDGLRDFFADEPAITTSQIVKLLFNRRLCYRQGRSQILIRNICAIRSKIKAQRLKQPEPTSALAFLAQTPKRLFDYCRSPTQVEQLLRRPRIERLRGDRQLRGRFSHPIIPRNEFHAATTFGCAQFLSGVSQEISQGLQQQRTETTSVAVGALKKRSLEQAREKILCEILCILG